MIWPVVFNPCVEKRNRRMRPEYHKRGLSSFLFRSSPFFFSRPSGSGGVYHQDLDAHARHITPTSPSPMRDFRSTSLPLDEDYAVQRSVSPLGTFKKRSRLDIDETNSSRLRSQPVAATEEETVRLLFSCCGRTPEVKLKIEWQMALLLKKINLNMTNGIASLAALH